LITHFSTSIPAKKSSTKIFFIIQLEENKKAPEFIRTGSTKSLSEQVQQSIISFLFLKKKKWPRLMAQHTLLYCWQIPTVVRHELIHMLHAPIEWCK
jgi:hypothetical protein